MAITNFIPTIWSETLATQLEKKYIAVSHCNREFEGEIKERGATVKICGVGDIAIGNYTKNSDMGDPQTLSDTVQELNIDQAKYFAFYVDDVNQAQSVPGLKEKYQEKAVHGLAVARDTYVANLIKGATNVTTATACEQEAVKQAIDEAIVALRERNFDEEGVIEITPAVFSVFKNCLITLSTDNPEYIKKGKVGTYDGFDVIMSNNLAKDSTYAYCDVRGKKAIAYAGQINDVEAQRSRDYFGDEVRGLLTFGAKVIDEARIQVIKVPVGA